jgi:hypothetical protein
MKKAFIAALFVLLAVRLALPFAAKKKINASLSSLKGYEGQVESVGLGLLRGRVKLENLEIRDTKKDFRLGIPRMTVDVAWGPLFKKELEAAVAVSGPVIKLVAPKPGEAAEKSVEKAQKAEANIEAKTGKSLDRLLKDLMPFRVSRLTIADGSIRVYEGAADQEDKEEKADARQRPKEPFVIGDIDVDVRDLTNKGDEPASGKAAAEFAGGTAALDLKLSPLAETPTFDMNLEVRGVDLARLSPLLRWQWNVDVDKGTFDMLCEVKAAEGSFKGYAKPFIKDFKAAPGKGAGPIKKAKQAVVNAVSKVLSNDETKEIATRVPFSGKFGDPKTGIWEAVVAVLRNAFVKALSPTFDRI